MTEQHPELTLRPIGTVRSPIKEPTHDDVSETVSEIVVESVLAEGLDSLDEFSHVIILYWLHRSRDDVPLKVRPRGKPENPLVGVFACRSPMRPNPLGKATVRLRERRGNVLVVEGLDAIDGTPVLDIKPYIPGYDSTEGAATPPWASSH